jgi:cobalt/nickel transport system ATP-binding protein
LLDAEVDPRLGSTEQDVSTSDDRRAAPSALLSCRNVNYAYLERFTALDDVSFDIASGEKVALLGANGCGKSTLLKILDGLLFADAGTYRAFGEEVSEANLEDEQFSMGFRSRVGFIFQNADAQVFSPSVRDDIAFGPLQLGWSREKVEHRIADVLGMLEIEDLADRAPFQLSGGEKKRVAIATVLVMNPDVLLFDEPTAALDPRTQAWLVDLILELNAAGKTIVMATHDLDILETVADRCLVFSEDHRLVGQGRPDDVLQDRRLLLDVNLIHDHTHIHRQGSEEESHEHEHHASHHEVEMTDPVCGMTVTPETAAAAWEHDGRTYYFCSVSCFERFREDPARYLSMDPSQRSM